MTQMDLTDIYRIIHPNIKEYTFFSVPHGNFSKTDHIHDKKKTSTDPKKWNNPMYLIGTPWDKTRIQQQY